MTMALVGPETPSLACQDLLNTPKSFRWGLELIIQIFQHECQNTRANVSGQMSKHCMRAVLHIATGDIRNCCSCICLPSVFNCVLFFSLSKFHLFSSNLCDHKGCVSLFLSLFFFYVDLDMTAVRKPRIKNKITEDGCRVRILKSADERK